MPATSPLDRFPLVRSQSVEEISAALARVYARPTFHVERGTRKIDAVFNLYQMTDVRIGYTRYGISTSLLYPESDVILQTLPIRGRAEARVKDFECSVDSGSGLTISAGEGLAVQFNANYEHLILLINEGALQNKLAAITGTSIDRPLRFEPLRDDRRAPGKALRDHFSFLVNAVSASAAPLPKLVLTEFEQLLLVMSLHANRHNYSDLLAGASPDGETRHVRRTEDYIEANWQQALTLESLAQVSGISALALFRTFKKVRGYSPMEFADRVRLRHARAMLEQQPDPTAGLEGIARHCGFADIARFVELYEFTFGEHPSRTSQRGGG